MLGCCMVQWPVDSQPCVHTLRLLPACAASLPADVAALQCSDNRGPSKAEGGKCSDERADAEAVCTQVTEQRCPVMFSGQTTHKCCSPHVFAAQQPLDWIVRTHVQLTQGQQRCSVLCLQQPRMVLAPAVVSSSCSPRQGLRCSSIQFRLRRLACSLALSI
jgi:hypothetical protein